MDLEIAKFINELGASTFVDFLTQFVSNSLFLILFGACIAISIFFFDKKHKKTVLLAILIAILLHFLISEGLFKYLLGYIHELRIRPYLAHPDTINSVGNQSYIDSSFPSSHMASTTAIITVLIYFYKKITIPGIMFILIMAFARIHNGMHYPTDVLAGTILGMIYGLSGIYTSRSLKVSNPT